MLLTIKKLWNILNHAGKPWQVSLAVSLAMIVGFTPIASAHNLLIFLLVFVLNVHLGMFLIALGFFSGIGYLFDPLFHSIGLSLLTNDALNSLWTAFYNNPFFKITNFNNSIVLGSLVVSVALFVPMMLIVNKVLVNYRYKLSDKVKSIPILNKFEYFTKEEISQVKVIRIAGVVVFGVFIGVLALLKGLYFDSIIKNTIEENITKNTEKTVTIGDIDSSIILNSKITINDLLVSDKKDITNNVAIDKIEIDFEFSKLLLKKLVVENLAMVNIHFPELEKQTKTQKKVTSKEKPKEESSISKNDLKDIANLGNIDISNTEELLNSDIKSKAGEFKKYYEKIKPIFNSQEKSETAIVHTRSNGSWVKFKDITDLPDVVVKRGAFSLTYDKESYLGKIKDFSTNQTVYNKPFKLTVGGNTKKIKNLDFELITFKTNKVDEDRVVIKFDSLDIQDQEKDKVSFKNTSLKAKMAFVVSNSKTLFGKANFNILNTDVEVKSSNKYVNKFNEHLKGMDNLNATAKINGEIDNPDVKLESNVESVLRNKLKEFVKSQEKELKEKLKNKIEDKVKKKLEEKIGNKLGDKLNDKIGSEVEDKIKGIFKF